MWLTKSLFTMLRKLFVLLFLSCSLFVNAQKQIFFCDFSEGVIPSDFVVIEGDGLAITSGTTAMYGIETEDGWTCTTSECLAAQYNQMPADTDFPIALTSSYYSESTKASDNWLITPVIDLSGISNATLSWKAWASSNVSYMESYRVLVSTSGNSKEDFVDAPVFSIEAEGTNWITRSVDLSSYVGKSIYIAFHNNTPQGTLGDALAIDDILVSGTEQEIEETIYLSDKTLRINWEDASVSAQLTAGDFTNINNFTVNLKYGDVDVTEDFSGLLISPGDSYDFTMEHKIEFMEGQVVPYALSVKMNEEVETVTGEISFVKDMDFNKKILVEELTGTWCGNCVSGIVGFRDMYEKYNDSFIGIAVHGPSLDLDPMTLDVYTNELQKYLGTGYPKAFVNRKIIGEPSFSSLEYEYEHEIGVFPACSINVESYFEDENMTSFNVETNVSFAFSSNYNPVRLFFVLLENNVQGNSVKYSQANYYSKDNGTGLEMGGYENMPDPIPYSNIQYQHVARAIIDDFYGIQESLPDTVVSGESYEFKLKYEVPENVLKSKNLEIVAIAVDTITGEVLNAQNSLVMIPSLINNAVTDDCVEIITSENTINLFFDKIGTYKAELYAINGLLLENREVIGGNDIYFDYVESGLYIVRIKYGDSLFVSKVIVE